MAIQAYSARAASAPSPRRPLALRGTPSGNHVRALAVAQAPAGDGWHLLTWLAVILLLVVSVVRVEAASAKDYAVLVQANASENPPTIRLSWPAHSAATGYAVSRKLLGAASWGTVTNLPGGATGWSDGSVSVGTRYEYKISRTTSLGVTGYGYVCAGIRIPAVDRRGTVILMVDSSMAGPLASQLQRLRDDLVGDGWSVIRHDVARTASVSSVKSLIVADYRAAPSEVRSVFLFGHVPVPYSADKVFAGGHAPEHHGAHPADLYYGEMDGTWTDSTVNHSDGNQWKHIWPNLGNVPGDGKFDQARIPGGTVELEVGRVDLANMPIFAPKTETDLLRQYLDKDHLHRHALRVLPRRGLIEDHFGEFSGAAFAAGGWRAWSSLFGSTAVGEGVFTTLSTQGHLGYFLCGPGWNTSCNTRVTQDFALNDPKAAFYMMLGSHFGDWNIADNFLRAPLATASHGLASVYNAPHWFLHTMAMGGTIGEATRLTQNNVSLYVQANAPWWETTNSTFTALMGDPTLRLFALAPPPALSIARNGSGHPALTWSAAPAASLGYHVYRAASANGPFVRVSASPVTATTWTDTGVASGTFTYQVKALALETTAGGTYINTSQAASASIALSGNPTPVVNAGADRTITQPASSVTLNGSATDNGTIASYAWSPVGSAATIVSPGSASTVVSGLTAGKHTFRLTATDNQGASGHDEVQVTVDPAAGGGFAATYFANPTLAGTPSLTRSDATIDFDWARGSPGGSLPVDGFSARWNGQIKAPAGGTFTFHLTSDDGARLWVGGNLIIDRWINQSATTWSGTIALSAGQTADLKLEYFDNLGGAMARLEWSGPGLARTVVLPSTTASPRVLPSGWTSGDVGAVGAAGSAGLDGGTWTVSGSGADIWDAADGFHFASRSLMGDGEITARVASQGNTHGWAKAGVMIRENRGAGARHAMAAITPANGATFLRRTSAGGATFSTPGAPAAAPCWLRLTRVGDEFSSYQSTDGATWRLIGRAFVIMGDDVQIGLGVTSHAAGTLGTVVFDHVEVIAGPAGSG